MTGITRPTLPEFPIAEGDSDGINCEDHTRDTQHVLDLQRSEYLTDGVQATIITDGQADGGIDVSRFTLLEKLGALTFTSGGIRYLPMPAAKDGSGTIQFMASRVASISEDDDPTITGEVDMTGLHIRVRVRQTLPDGGTLSRIEDVDLTPMVKAWVEQITTELKG